MSSKSCSYKVVDGAFCQLFDYIYIIFIWLWLVEQVAGVQKSLSDIDFDLGELHNMVSGLVSFPLDWWSYPFIAFSMSSLLLLYFHRHVKSFFFSFYNCFWLSISDEEFFKTCVYWEEYDIKRYYILGTTVTWALISLLHLLTCFRTENYLNLNLNRWETSSFRFWYFKYYIITELAGGSTWEHCPPQWWFFNFVNNRFQTYYKLILIILLRKIVSNWASEFQFLTVIDSTL